MSLKEKSMEIQEAFESTKKELRERLEQISKDIDSYTEEYRIANTHGDRSENAAFEDAVKNLQRANSEYSEIANNYNATEAVKDINKYSPIGVIVLYTTVQLKCLDDGSIYIYRIFPKGVSDLERGIMAEDSRIGKALMGHTKGETIKVVHNVKGSEYNYIIEDIY